MTKNPNIWYLRRSSISQLVDFGKWAGLAMVALFGGFRMFEEPAPVSLVGFAATVLGIIFSLVSARSFAQWRTKPVLAILNSKCIEFPDYRNLQIFWAEVRHFEFVTCMSDSYQWTECHVDCTDWEAIVARVGWTLKDAAVLFPERGSSRKIPLVVSNLNYSEMAIRRYFENHLDDSKNSTTSSNDHHQPA